jgi:hypothetical protein
MNNKARQNCQYRCKRSQKGEAELMTFGIAVLVATLLSGSLYVLHWVKNNKHSEREARYRAMLEEKLASQYSGRRDPAEYLASCEKPFWAVLKTDYSCQILPESYGELFLKP